MIENCRALHEADPNVKTVVAAGGADLDPSWEAELKELMPHRMDLRLFPSVGRHTIMISVPLLYWIWRHVDEFDLVVVRALFHPVSSMAALIARCQKVPYLVVPHGTLSEYTFEHRRSRLKKLYFAAVDRWTLEGAAAVRFTSDAERQQAPNSGSSERARVIPHPFHDKDYSRERDKEEVSQVLFLSRLHPGKGLDVLLPALRQLWERHEDTRVVLAGAGSRAYEMRLRREIRSLGLHEEKLILPGFVEGRDKRRFLLESSVFVLPSRQESFGMAVVEAMAAGLPVIITRGVGIWREVEDAGAGMVVARTPDAVCDALVALLGSPEVREQMGQRAQRLVKNRFDPQQIGSELRRLYRRIVQPVDSNSEL